MRISFDLDGVLFVNPKEFETEPELPAPLNQLYPERLREGTVQLIRTLQAQTFEVWVYTSSYRSELYIRALFWHYGIKFTKIINGEIHDRLVQSMRAARLPSKMPANYQISLHIDDEDMVVENGRVYGFRVLQIKEPDPQWTEKVLEEVNRIREIEKQFSSG